MKETIIFQTLENRNNLDEVTKHGPYFCSFKDDNDVLKKGAKEPWLGEGYYFWDTNESDAIWWGNVSYNSRYYVFKSKYDQHSELLFDILGNLDQFNELLAIAETIKEERNLTTISFPTVIHYLRTKTTFDKKYKAIRVFPAGNKLSSNITFPCSKNNKPLEVAKLQKVQICFYDKSLIKEWIFSKSNPRMHIIDQNKFISPIEGLNTINETI